MRNIGFRLVVVVIADEVFDAVFGEEVFKLAEQLGRQGFVLRNDQSRAMV